MGRSGARKRVGLVHAWIGQFRRGFHDALRDHLAQRGIDLDVVYGQPPPHLKGKEDAISLRWAPQVRNRYLPFGNTNLVWQPATRLLRDADLVVVGQRSHDLFTYPLFAAQMAGFQRMAFWGHGRNMDAQQASPTGEYVKRLMSRRVHWWFAYNDYSASVVRDLGFPADRISVVRNTLDTRAMVEQRGQVTAAAVEAARRELGLKGDHVAVYSGGMYPVKWIPYLLEACRLIREDVPDFEMIFIGGGPDAHLVAAAAAEHEWMHAVGPKFDGHKVPYFALSKLLLMPGRVGLVVIDSFALETPLVTVDHDQHSVEVDYLTDGRDGVVLPTGTGPEGYAKAVADLLCDEDARQRLVRGCRASAAEFSIEEMAARFGRGVEEALDAPPRTLLRTA
jgi:glycosyltransferase involved in cell wall biosynthesis